MADSSTNSVVRGCGFHHVAIRTADWDKSQRFWREGLGFTPKVEWGEAPSRAVLLDTGDGNYLEIFERIPAQNILENEKPSNDEGLILHFCFRADDCDAAVETARAAGGKVTVEPKFPDVFEKFGIKAKIAFIQGPDGEICEFFECPQL
jgi:glyoxylase I family protein